jgi:DNA-directed RNA polymerase specialized sigma subunit
MIKDRGKKLRNELQWVMVLKLRKSGMTLQKIGDTLGISKQRVHQLINLAKVHQGKHDGELSDKIGKLMVGG